MSQEGVCGPRKELELICSVVKVSAVDIIDTRQVVGREVVNLDESIGDLWPKQSKCVLEGLDACGVSLNQSVVFDLLDGCLGSLKLQYEGCQCRLIESIACEASLDSTQTILKIK